MCLFIEGLFFRNFVIVYVVCFSSASKTEEPNSKAIGANTDLTVMTAAVGSWPV